MHEEVFFLNTTETKEKQKIMQNKLIKDYYTLLNNKKTFDRENVKANYTTTL